MSLLDSYLPLTDIDTVSSSQTVNLADLAANCLWSPTADDIRTAIESMAGVEGVYSVTREATLSSVWSVDIQPATGVTVGLLRSQAIAAMRAASEISGTGCFSPSVGDITIKQANGNLPGIGTTVGVSLTAIAVIAVAIIIFRR